MHSKLRIAVSLAACLPLFMADHAAAQSTSADVTFEVPLNLTNLASDITKVRMTCRLLGGPIDGRVGQVEIPVSGGQVVTTAQVVVLVPLNAFPTERNPVGRPQNYDCNFEGYSPAVGWDTFIPYVPAMSSYTGFRLTSFHIEMPTLVDSYGRPRTGSAVMTGTFNW